MPELKGSWGVPGAGQAASASASGPDIRPFVHTFSNLKSDRIVPCH
jgi:hypothetical protein